MEERHEDQEEKGTGRLYELNALQEKGPLQSYVSNTTTVPPST